MKKTLITLGSRQAAATGVAQAQSSVVITVPLTLVSSASAAAKDGNVNKLDSGIASASRLGFKGTEDWEAGLLGTVPAGIGV